MKSSIRIGTRGSQLALYQAELVKTRISQDFPLVTVEIVKIKTSGDMIRRGGTAPFETKRIYTREIEDALLKSEIDLAVHSAKDLAAIMPDGLKIGAVLEREDPRDCLVSRDKKKLSELPLGARIGTSSLRRKMQLLRWNAELIVEEIHGNVDTRIRKIDDGEFDAVVLAYAGIKRIGFGNCVSEIFPEDTFYPAPGQGVIAVQSRVNDQEVDEILEPLHHALSGKRLDCERAFLRRLEGGCQLPCGVTTAVHNGRITARGALFATEGHEWVEQRIEGTLDQAAHLGENLANLILANGGRVILEKIKQNVRPTLRHPERSEGSQL
ncbi:MAG: hydroxymethylbilane synthase [Candidatus Omnitrophica bacterium]|nr:hydroxymethylbilane synthase [Candidatus Omnitrophota bacterium]